MINRMLHRKIARFKVETRRKIKSNNISKDFGRKISHISLIRHMKDEIWVSK